VQESKVDREEKPQSTIKTPIDIILSLLKPEELEKLKRYIAVYQRKHNQLCSDPE
jgi:hypothetical protein